MKNKIFSNLVFILAISVSLACFSCASKSSYENSVDISSTDNTISTSEDSYVPSISSNSITSDSMISSNSTSDSVVISTSSNSPISSSTSESSEEILTDLTFKDFNDALSKSNPTKIVNNITYTLKDYNLSLSAVTKYTFNYDNGTKIKIERQYEQFNSFDSDELISTITETYFIDGYSLYEYDGSNMFFVSTVINFKYRNINFEERYFNYDIEDYEFIGEVKKEYEGNFFENTAAASSIEFAIYLNSDKTLSKDIIAYKTNNTYVTSEYIYNYNHEVVNIPEI